MSPLEARQEESPLPHEKAAFQASQAFNGLHRPRTPRGQLLIPSIHLNDRLVQKHLCRNTLNRVLLDQTSGHPMAQAS